MATGHRYAIVPFESEGDITPDFVNTELLTLQMASDEGRHLRTVAVMMDELLKLVVCIGILFFFYLNSRSQHSSKSLDFLKQDQQTPFISIWLTFAKKEVFGSMTTILSMGVPAVCYAVKKNPSVRGYQILEPSSFQNSFPG